MRRDEQEGDGEEAQEVPSLNALAPVGAKGATRRYRRDSNERLFLRMVRNGWTPPEADRLDDLREMIENVVLHSPDPRAKVMAYNSLLAAEIAIVQSNIAAEYADSQIHATEATDYVDDAESE